MLSTAVVSDRLVIVAGNCCIFVFLNCQDIDKAVKNFHQLRPLHIGEIEDFLNVISTVQVGRNLGKQLVILEGGTGHGCLDDCFPLVFAEGLQDLIQGVVFISDILLPEKNPFCI